MSWAEFSAHWNEWLNGDLQGTVIVIERRRIPRLRTLKGGSIIFGVAPSVDCIIRNLSQDGAALEVASPVAIPDEFVLLIKPERVKRNCRVMWRSEKSIGIQFLR